MWHPNNIQDWNIVDCDVKQMKQMHPYKHIYAISQLRIVHSGLHLVTYLDVGNFCDKSTETTLHEICVQGFLRFSDSNKPSQANLYR